MVDYLSGQSLSVMIDSDLKTVLKRSFDRRYSYRLGSNVTTALKSKGKGETLTGVLRNVSDTGACLELDGVLTNEWKIFKLDIPNIYDKKLNCRITWSDINSYDNTAIYGIKFLGLSNNDRKRLRNKLMLNEELFMLHAKPIMDRFEDVVFKEAIRNYFVVTLRDSIKKLMDIEKSSDAIGYSKKFLDSINKIIHNLLKVGNDLEHKIGELHKDSIGMLKRSTRILSGYFLYKSKIIRRALEKPRGYAGDYKILEYIYDNIDESSGLGRYFDRIFLDDLYIKAIRNIKDKTKTLLLNHINTNKNKENYKIVNLASGSFRELREMLTESKVKYQQRIDVLGVDLDEAALKYSEKKMSMLDKHNFKLEFLRGNLLEIDRIHEINVYNSVDLIYSIGISDYFDNEMFGKVIEECFKRLKVGGHMIFDYKVALDKKPLFVNWFCDWYFKYRDKDDVKKLIHHFIDEDKLEIEFTDDTLGLMSIVTLKKLRV